MTAEKITPGKASPTVEETLARRKQALETKLRRLYDLYAESGNRVLLDSINSLLSEIEQLDKNIAQEAAHGAVTKSAQAARAQLHSVKGVWDYLKVPEKRTNICSLVEKITVTHNEVVIEYRL